MEADFQGYCRADEAKAFRAFFWALEAAILFLDYVCPIIFLFFLYTHVLPLPPIIQHYPDLFALASEYQIPNQFWGAEFVTAQMHTHFWPRVLSAAECSKLNERCVCKSCSRCLNYPKFFLSFRYQKKHFEACFGIMICKNGMERAIAWVSRCL